MKKLICLLLLCLLPSLAYAQRGAQHLTFMGIPIDGQLSTFVEKMKQRGFSLRDIGSGAATLRGTFAGYSNCEVMVVATPRSKRVHTVLVSFGVEHSWESLHDKYMELKVRLSGKYNKTYSIEEFPWGEPETNYGKLEAAKMGMINYVSSYSSDLGTIILNVRNAKNEKATYVTLTYVDRVNGSIKEGYDDDL